MPWSHNETGRLNYTHHILDINVNSIGNGSSNVNIKLRQWTLWLTIHENAFENIVCKMTAILSMAGAEWGDGVGGGVIYNKFKDI